MTPSVPISEPTLAVVICTKDRPDALVATLESIWSQSRQPDEIIVIDDGKMPGSICQMIVHRGQACGVPVGIHPNRSAGLTAARNFAADLAQSDVLVYLDDDVTCDKDFLRVVAALMSDPSVTGVTARVAEPSLDTPAGRLYQLGYRLAGWWRVGPRGIPPPPPPRALANPRLAVRARWLSGAAMALRREVVRQYRFDESLTRYALGEDREMGYRLGPRHWLLESRAARVIHRREVSQRTESRRLGYMTSRDYLYILEKTCRLGPGQWLLIGWSLSVLMAMHAFWAVFGTRQAHLDELLGMLSGIGSYFREGRPRAQRKLAHTASPLASGPKPHVASPSTPRRVLFVTNRLEPGGAERMLVNLVKCLPAAGIDPVIACLKDAGPLAGPCRDAGIPIYERVLHHKYDTAAIRRIRQIIAEHHVDAVVVAHSGGDRMFWSTLAAGLTDTPVVVWSHWFPRAGRHHFERANRLLYRWVSAYVALGERHRDAMIRYEQVPAGRIRVIPNALDLARFMQLAPRSEARRRLRLDADQLGIGIIANLRHEKRHDVFIAAARRLSSENPRLRFFIIGDGPDRDAVQAAAAASGLDHEILRWMGPREDVPELLSGLDIACLCSEVECFSVTMLEAAAAKCPFIGPNTGCLPEFIDHRRTGLLIRPADVGGLADAIRELVNDSVFRRALAEAAHARVVREFGLEVIAARFSELIASLPSRLLSRERATRRRPLHEGSPKVAAAQAVS